MTNLTDMEKVRLGPLTVVDQAGHVITPSPIDGVPNWVNDNPTAITLEVDPDGLNAWAIGNEPGVAMITVTADCDPSSGVSEFSAVAELAVGHSAVAGVQLAVGTPEPK